MECFIDKKGLFYVLKYIIKLILRKNKTLRNHPLHTFRKLNFNYRNHKLTTRGMTLTIMVYRCAYFPPISIEISDDSFVRKRIKGVSG